MVMVKKHPVHATALLFVALLLPSIQPTDALGVCYGGNGNNLPSKQDVINLYKSNNIGLIRIYNPDQEILKAVQGSNIKVILGVPNDNVQSLGSNPSAALQWVQTNVVPYASSIKYVDVGNEIKPSDQIAPYVAPALQNVLNALNSANLGGQIKVSTTIDMNLVTNTSPPSSGTFTDVSYMGPIVNFLTRNGSPFLLDVYPYFAYIYNKQSIDINYALLNPGIVVTDSGNQLQYHNLFDAQVDSVYAALSKVGGSNIVIVVTESGWPSDGGDSATVDNARTYYRNLIGQVKKGTPLKPKALETFLFAMFDENQKPGDASE